MNGFGVQAPGSGYRVRACRVSKLFMRFSRFSASCYWGLQELCFTSASRSKQLHCTACSWFGDELCQGTGSLRGPPPPFTPKKSSISGGRSPKCVNILILSNLATFHLIEIENLAQNRLGRECNQGHYIDATRLQSMVQHTCTRCLVEGTVLNASTCSSETVGHLRVSWHVRVDKARSVMTHTAIVLPNSWPVVTTLIKLNAIAVAAEISAFAIKCCHNPTCKGLSCTFTYPGDWVYDAALEISRYRRQACALVSCLGFRACVLSFWLRHLRISGLGFKPLADQSFLQKGGLCEKCVSASCLQCITQ